MEKYCNNQPPLHITQLKRFVPLWHSLKPFANALQISDTLGTINEIAVLLEEEK